MEVILKKALFSDKSAELGDLVLRHDLGAVSGDWLSGEDSA